MVGSPVFPPIHKVANRTQLQVLAQQFVHHLFNVFSPVLTILFSLHRKDLHRLSSTQAHGQMFVSSPLVCVVILASNLSNFV